MKASVSMERLSITLPQETARDVRVRVGRRGFSAYVASAVRHQLEHDALGDILARLEADHGPASEAEVQAIMTRLGE